MKLISSNNAYRLAGLHRFLRDVRKGHSHKREHTCRALFPCVYTWSLTCIVPSLLRPPITQSAPSKQSRILHTTDCKNNQTRLDDKTGAAYNLSPLSLLSLLNSRTHPTCNSQQQEHSIGVHSQHDRPRAPFVRIDPPPETAMYTRLQRRHPIQISCTHRLALELDR